ncbi:helix-turn-helix domain-containing protein [Methyloferula stellata]|uniref:helix-turn-helix domain-containing protein n=1 Tax=Methyloferula stellata TaxID=876270 RepID=UPI00037F1D8F|nr:helix-turn-helix transcriptional regulator [Methyloferula stellata]
MLAAQCSVARAILDLTVEELAKKAGVTADIILRIEAGAPLDEDTLAKVQAAFETEGVEFTFGDRPGVKIRTLDGIIEVSAGGSVVPLKH